MKKQRVSIVAFLSAIVGALVSADAAAAPQPITRDQIISIAKSGVGYSYWWGHGRWRSDGAQEGSCSGSCPGCSHNGKPMAMRMESGMLVVMENLGKKGAGLRKLHQRLLVPRRHVEWARPDRPGAMREFRCYSSRQ